MQLSLVTIIAFISSATALTIGERHEELETRGRSCKEVWGDCNNCFDRSPMCHIDKIPSSIS